MNCVTVSLKGLFRMDPKNCFSVSKYLLATLFLIFFKNKVVEHIVVMLKVIYYSKRSGISIGNALLHECITKHRRFSDNSFKERTYIRK